jgi:hypothetical protein
VPAKEGLGWEGLEGLRDGTWQGLDSTAVDCMGRLYMDRMLLRKARLY